MRCHIVVTGRFRIDQIEVTASYLQFILDPTQTHDIGFEKKNTNDVVTGRYRFYQIEVTASDLQFFSDPPETNQHVIRSQKKNSNIVETDVLNQLYGVVNSIA